MDGIQGEKLEIETKEAAEAVETIASLEVVSAVDDETAVSTGSETVLLSDINVPDLRERSRNYGKILSGLLCGILAVTGVLSYGFIGYNGVEYLKNGGLRQLAAMSVYGGIITVAKPMGNDEHASPTIPPEAEIPVGETLQIVSENIGCSNPDQVFNETDYKLEGVTAPVSAVPQYAEGKTVLIIHTHGTEGYASEGNISENEDFRTSDPSKSIVAVGSAFAEVLEAKGVRTVHCTEMFDAESYANAYYLSGKAVEKYIADDPEISYVIDIHRDAVIREDGTVVRSDGAQLMIVCGTDEMGADFPDWRENFAFGKTYQHRLYGAAPEMVRHMNLRSASFNQQLADRYLLLEVGTCGNTIEEAIESAKFAAEVFADTIRP